MDPDGAVLASASVVSDEEIVGWMAMSGADAAVVGFDAPLIVRNLTGRRHCEALLSRAFAGQRAGCYPSNLSLSAFTDGGRAFELARRLGLALDPEAADATGCGLAAEVYPHSALVALFGLPERLEYKAGRGRTVESRRTEMLRLVSFLLGLTRPEPPLVPLVVEAGPRWSSLTGTIPTARHVDLDRVEDELDAHVCAYVALLLAADRADGGHRVRVLGDWSDGAVVTPVDDRHVAILGPAGEMR